MVDRERLLRLCGAVETDVAFPSRFSGPDVEHLARLGDLREYIVSVERWVDKE